MTNYWLNRRDIKEYRKNMTEPFFSFKGRFQEAEVNKNERSYSSALSDDIAHEINEKEWARLAEALSDCGPEEWGCKGQEPCGPEKVGISLEDAVLEAPIEMYSEEVVINGNTTIKGDLHIVGNLTVEGTIYVVGS